MDWKYEYLSVLGVQAVGTITMAGVAVADETFIVYTQTYIWKGLRVGVGEVTIGASAAEAVTNLVVAINADLASFVLAKDGVGNTVVVTAVDILGVAGNAILFSQTSTNMAMDGAGFLGGTTSGVDAVISDRGDLTTVATWDVLTIDADGTDAATLGATLPNPTTIHIEFVSVEGAEAVDDFIVADGSLVLKASVIGTYKVTAKTAAYIDYTVTITAVAP